ncbi:MAG: sigma-54-dependent transcriptional regulator [Thermodesulfobacteriota bacterium]
MRKKRTLRVLIVDDDSNLRELLEEGVQDWGYDVGTAGSGEEAMQCLATDNYNVVVCDLKMPGMGGLKLLSAIKAFDSMIQVIIITGYATLDTAVKAMEAGAYEYLTKPFRLDELMVIMKKISKRVNEGEGGKAFHKRLNSTHGELEVMRALQRNSSKEPSE